MLSYAEALARALAAADEKGRLPFSSVPCADALGRVAAADVPAPEALPAFANSAMDGFAVVAAATAGARAQKPATLRVLGCLAAGDPPPAAGPTDGCWEIMTGAPIPAGFDAVVRVEDAERAPDGGAAVFREAASPGDFVRPAGGDFQKGQPVCRAGDVLDERHLMAFAALGLAKIPARRKPRAAVISTGKELVEPPRAPGPGQIRNSSAAYLMAALARLGAEPRSYGVAADEPADFRRRLDAALSDHHDVVVTTGAVSAGKHDFIARALADAGAEVLFHGVALRPGKPILCARLGEGMLFFGLPGNPVSTAVGLRFFVAPVLARLLGRPDERPGRARLAAPLQKPAALRCFLKAAARREGAVLLAEPSGGQGSHQIASLVSADGWLCAPESRERFEPGEELEFYGYWP